jgi:uncharacterized membrane protein
MGNGKTIGMWMFVAGIILLIAYGLFLGFDEVVEAFDIITGLLLAIMISGLIILMVSIVIEQRRDMKKMREEISKEDLKP